VRELLLGSVGAQNLVETEKVCLIRLALELVRVAGETQADLCARGIAGLPYTGGGRHVFPGTAEIRENILETIEGVLNTILRLEAADRNVPDPCVDRVHRKDDIVVEVFAFARQVVCELAARETQGKIFLLTDD
jgi:hypothetical protein